MRIHSTSVVNHPRQRVFEAYRDQLPDIAAYIPDIREIQVQRRGDEGGRVQLHNVWIADRELPSFARGILQPDMLRWDDFADWDLAAWCCTWRMKTRAFTESVRCSGTNRFEAIDEGSTRVVLAGDLEIDVKSIPGVPRLLAGRLKPQVERFIVSLITPNLEQVNTSLGRFLDDQA